MRQGLNALPQSCFRKDLERAEAGLHSPATVYYSSSATASLSSSQIS